MSAKRLRNDGGQNMVYILLASGFEEIEAITPCDLLRRAGVDAKFVGVGGKRIDGSHGFVVEADLSLEEASETLPEMIVLPGGRRGVESLLADHGVFGIAFVLLLSRNY